MWKKIRRKNRIANLVLTLTFSSVVVEQLSSTFGGLCDRTEMSNVDRSTDALCSLVDGVGEQLVETELLTMLLESVCLWRCVEGFSLV